MTNINNDELKRILSELNSKGEENIHNASIMLIIDNDMAVYLELIARNFIEPLGKFSKLTQHGKDTLKVLDV
ncbi:MAG: hypothetical protein WC856_21790 [Methylococcaceae bacterium]|jgi:hypothetical protein